MLLFSGIIRALKLRKGLKNCKLQTFQALIQFPFSMTVNKTPKDPTGTTRKSYRNYLKSNI